MSLLKYFAELEVHLCPGTTQSLCACVILQPLRPRNLTYLVASLVETVRFGFVMSP